MTAAFTRVRDFATSMMEDLELVDRNRAVSFILSLSIRPPIKGLSFGGCAQAYPLGVVPEIRADFSQSVRIFFTLPLSCRPLIGRLSSSGCAQAHPLGVVPEIQADCSQ